MIANSTTWWQRSNPTTLNPGCGYGSDSTAGWWTAELGRQPWVVYGLLRTASAHSELVSPGDVVFTLLGFAGLYLLLGMLFVLQVLKELTRGPVKSH